MSLAVLIPWRGGDPWRERLYDWVVSEWLKTDLDVFVGNPTDMVGPFSCSSALNNARRRAPRYDYYVVAAADHIPSPVAIADAGRSGDVPWAPLFGSTAGLSRDTTEALITGLTGPQRIPKRFPEGETGFAPFCTALMVVRADVWDEVGGYDERFVGWGCEDTAFRLALETLYPTTEQPAPTATTYALWHEAASREHFGANAALVGEYMTASSSPEAMRDYLRSLR